MEHVHDIQITKPARIISTRRTELLSSHTCRLWESALIRLVKSDPFGDIPAAPGGLANASRPHSKLCTRSPLSGELITGNPPLVTASARNPRPFTRVHSHAAAPKSSGAFFHDTGRERYPKRP
nr:Hypothetical protein [Raoultella ornithinolytica]